MKQKYYKYTKEYCRKLRLKTLFPIGFKLPDMSQRYMATKTNVITDATLCDGRVFTKKDYPQMFEILKGIQEEGDLKENETEI